MAIKEYIHGDGKDYQLWGNVGRLIVDKTIQDKLGIHVTSDVGDIWWVSLTHKSKTKGFASARPLKNKNLHLRYFYHEDEKGLGVQALIKKAINHAQANGFVAVVTNWHKDSELLPKLGFTAIPRKTGKFCRWELEIKQ